MSEQKTIKNWEFLLPQKRTGYLVWINSEYSFTRHLCKLSKSLNGVLDLRKGNLTQTSISFHKTNTIQNFCNNMPYYIELVMIYKKRHFRSTKYITLLELMWIDDFVGSNFLIYHLSYERPEHWHILFLSKNSIGYVW